MSLYPMTVTEGDLHDIGDAVQDATMEPLENSLRISIKKHWEPLKWVCGVTDPCATNSY